MKEIFPKIWIKGKKIFTESLLRGERVYTKSVIKNGEREFREWNPYKSKPSAAISKGLKIFPIKPGDKILYLGVASGATATFFSDIIGEDGIIYGVEISDRSVRDLNPIAERRGNIVPIIADARRPEEYEWIERVDVVYEDVASDDQIPILIRNAKAFLKPNGHAVIAIKSRSIDVTKEPKDIYKQEIRRLSEYFNILDKIILDPYEKDHMFIVMKWKV